MQILILDKNIEQNALYYCDKHIVKIPTEICQLLCTRARIFHKELPDFCYKSTHIHHPLVTWTGESTGNWDYTVKLGRLLLNEYYYRFEHYNKHLRNRQILQHFTDTFPCDVFANPRTEFYQAVPKEYKNVDPIKAYRDYFVNDKSHLFKWTKRPIPKWIPKEKIYGNTSIKHNS